MIKKIESALGVAIEHACQNEDSSSRAELHRSRSKNFVEEIGYFFRSIDDETRDSYCVFTKHYDGNRLEYGLNELLYDVLVCDTGKTNSIKGGKELSYVKKAIWQIESEFQESNIRKLIWDFNKLVIGNGENKLFICSKPGPGNDELFLSSLKPLAACCSGNVFIAFVPHPSNWGKDELKYVACKKYDKIIDEWMEN